MDAEEEELFNKIEQIKSDLKHTIKMFGTKKGSVSNATTMLVDECKDLSNRFTQAIKEYLGPGLWP